MRQLIRIALVGLGLTVFGMAAVLAAKPFKDPFADDPDVLAAPTAQHPGIGTNEYSRKQVVRTANARDVEAPSSIRSPARTHSLHRSPRVIERSSHASRRRVPGQIQQVSAVEDESTLYEDDETAPEVDSDRTHSEAIANPVDEPGTNHHSAKRRPQSGVGRVGGEVGQPPATAQNFDAIPTPFDGPTWTEAMADPGYTTNGSFAVPPGATAPSASAASKPRLPDFQIMGAVQVDAGWFNQDTVSRESFGAVQDGAGFRRARFGAKGKLTENTNGFLQVDLAFFGKPTMTDLWVEMTNVPVLGTVRVGQWKMPFSLEVATSFRYQTFLERSVLFQGFEPFRHVAVGFYDRTEDERWTWAANVFRNGNDQYGNDIGSSGGYSTVERITHLMWYDDDTGERYLHIGAAHVFANPTNRRARFASIPEFFVGAVGTPAVVGTSRVPVFGPQDGTPPFVDTGFFGVNNINTFGLEFLLVDGPWTFQSEAQWAVVNPTGGGIFTFPGAYGQVSCFLTGEHRPYDKVLAATDRVKPRRDVITKKGRGVQGIGAWEVAARVSHIDLNPGGRNGGRMTDLTLGLNWYLNPYWKVQANYIRSITDNVTFGRGHTDIFALRSQFDF